MSQAMMGCIPAFSRGAKADPHSVPETRGLACDGCPLLACIEQKKSRLRRYRYWCDRAHAKIDPSVGCDRKPLRAIEQPPFHEELRSAMERAGYDEDSLAKAVGAARRTVLAWTSGKVKPNKAFMKRVADVLGVELGSGDCGWQAFQADRKAKLGI